MKNTKKSPPAAPGKKRKAAAAAATSNGSSTGGSGNSRAPTVTDNALTPSGLLGHRLSRAERHFPHKPLAARAKCALHRLASKEVVVTKDVVLCSSCRVHLCLSCFLIFHMEEDLCARKKKLGDQFETAYKESSKKQKK